MRRTARTALLLAATLATTSLLVGAGMAAERGASPRPAADRPTERPAADRPGADRFPDIVPLPDGFQPEGITSGPGATAYVGSLADGAIWSGSLRTGEGDILVEGEPGRTAVGTEYDRRTGRLWVAGGATGEIRAYDADSGDLLQTYQVEGAGFLNDLTVTRDAVYATDSVVQ